MGLDLGSWQVSLIEPGGRHFHGLVSSPPSLPQQFSPAPLPAELLAPLTYISLVGCSVSIVASLLTLLLHFHARYAPMPRLLSTSPSFLLGPPEWDGFLQRAEAPRQGTSLTTWLLVAPCPPRPVSLSLCVSEPRPGWCPQATKGHAPTRRKQSNFITRIHMHLHASVLLLNVAFLLSPALAQPPVPGAACMALGAVLHFALLSCLTWMAIEGFNLYLLLGRVYNIYVRRYVLKLCAVGWGEPSLPPSCSPRLPAAPSIRPPVLLLPFLLLIVTTAGPPSSSR